VIRRLLIANRGEIAVRIARAAREMDIAPLGIYSEADARAYHLRFMDEARCVGGAAATESYLNAAAIMEAARAMHADAIHPGYGFLSERAAFARAVIDAGLIFVGPSSDAMAAMGSKIEAKRRVRKHDVPTISGYDGDDQSREHLRAEAERIGVPLLIKASASGGGRGMRVVESLERFDESLEAAKREAAAAFGDDTVLLERYLRNPRHIEFQVLADAHGTTIHLGERECSIQRRHQKIVEETPSVALSPELRARMGAAAIRAAQSVNYVNAGTCEFMLDEDGAFYFLEMNTRLQVEHPVTELVYDLDLVSWQIRIAAGERLVLSQEDVTARGWAVEARIYAEDPANNLLPSIGTIATWRAPEGPGVRVDAGVDAGSEVSLYYDPMLAKLIAFGADRPQAIARLRDALDDFAVAGVRTNIPLLAWIVRDEAFLSGETTTGFLDQRWDAAYALPKVSAEIARLAAGAVLAAGCAPWRVGGVGVPLNVRFGETVVSLHATALADGWRLDGDFRGTINAQLSGERVRVTFDNRVLAGLFFREARGFSVASEGRRYFFDFAPAARSDVAGVVGGTGGDGRVAAPMPGKIVKISVHEGDAIAEHDLLLVLEAMKMEHRIEAAGAGNVKAIFVREGEIVPAGAPLVEVA
jgi:3-methylcrotonyl-CoA carboxylase alpha subunit